jgi:hypothetical protein
MMSMRTGKSGQIPRFTHISSQFIYLVVIVFLRRLDDVLVAVGAVTAGTN